MAGVRLSFEERKQIMMWYWKFENVAAVQRHWIRDLADSIFPSIRALYGDEFYFQQDGVPPHYHREVRAYLDHNVPGQWIGRRGPIKFPACSPDLTPLDFFLSGTVKDEAYKRIPRHLDTLRNETPAVCAEIWVDTL
ncbi:solute carrier organic anion transporter family member 2B1 X3, partial [Biomphalaria glabrata]